MCYGLWFPNYSSHDYMNVRLQWDPIEFFGAKSSAGSEAMVHYQCCQSPPEPADTARHHEAHALLVPYRSSCRDAFSAAIAFGFPETSSWQETIGTP